MDDCGCAVADCAVRAQTMGHFLVRGTTPRLLARGVKRITNASALAPFRTWSSCARVRYNGKYGGHFARFAHVGPSLRQRPLYQRETKVTVTAIAVAISVATLNSALLLRPREGKAQETASSDHSLSFFADEQDAPILLGRLNADPEIAAIVPDGPRVPPPASPPMGDRRRTQGVVVAMATCGWGWDGYWQRWRAVRPVDGLRDGEHILWHTSAGPLVSDDGPRSELRPIPDPSAGWTSQRPLCGPNILAAATIRLHLVTRYAAYTPEERATLRSLISYWINRDLLVASDFQWTGASLQPGGSLQTARWAADLKDWFSRNAVGLRARDSTEVFWAFPSALQRLNAGLQYDARGFDLDESIRHAR